MPELPEVHALVTDLGHRLTGRVIDRFEPVSFAALKTFDPPVSRLAGGTIVGVQRHGKYLDIIVESPDADGAIEGLHLIFHLARAGWVRWRPGAPSAASGRPNRGPLAARLILEGGSGFDLTEYGSKKSLAIWIVRSPSDVPGIRTLGPDPLGPGFTPEVFAAILSVAGRSQIKGVLRSQSIIAGIGNAYSDEILHAARMSPFAPASMGPDEVARLYTAIRETLTAAIERADGLAASELKAEKKSNMQVHARAGMPCPVCGDTVREVKFADSSLQYCPTCQTGGRVLSDRVLSRLLK